jgi:hypothetical protein
LQAKDPETLHNVSAAGQMLPDRRRQGDNLQKDNSQPEEDAPKKPRLRWLRNFVRSRDGGPGEDRDADKLQQHVREDALAAAPKNQAQQKVDRSDR